VYVEIGISKQFLPGSDNSKLQSLQKRPRVQKRQAICIVDLLGGSRRFVLGLIRNGWHGPRRRCVQVGLA